MINILISLKPNEGVKYELIFKGQYSCFNCIVKTYF